MSEIDRSADVVIDGCSFFSRGWHERLEIAGVTALQMTVPWPDDDSRQAINRYLEYYRLVDDEPRLMIVTTTDDIRSCSKEGRVGFILGSQDGRMLGESLEMIDACHNLGVRVIQLTYNTRNFIGDGCLEPTNAGLSRFGRTVVNRMNRVGVMIDLSHVGERTSLEALSLSDVPCIFSHSNPKALSDNPRNITDEQIRECAAAGGVIGLSSWAPICWRGGDEPPTIDDLIAHIEYVVDLVGIDHVALGTDSEATPGAYPPELKHGLVGARPASIRSYLESFPDNPKTRGFETMEDLPGLKLRLKERGWDETAIARLFGLNLLRVYGQAWKESS